MKPKVAIVTTCMGRTIHLKQTLFKMLDQDYRENTHDCIVVVVDWSSPDDLQSYLSSFRTMDLMCAEVPDKQHFSLSGARNAGGQYLLDIGLVVDYLAFIDADILLPKDFISKNVVKLTPKTFLQRNKTVLNDMGIWGSCIVPFEAWNEIRYNEDIDTYGEEDNEFYSVLVEKGYNRRALETEGIAIIAHSDKMRMEFYREEPEDIPRLKREHKNKFRASPWQ